METGRVCLEGNKEDGLMAAAGLLPVNAGGRCEERAVGGLPTGALVSSGTAWVLDEVETSLGEVTLAE